MRQCTKVAAAWIAYLLISVQILIVGIACRDANRSPSIKARDVPIPDPDAFFVLEPPGNGSWSSSFLRVNGAKSDYRRSEGATGFGLEVEVSKDQDKRISCSCSPPV